MHDSRQEDPDENDGADTDLVDTQVGSSGNLGKSISNFIILRSQCWLNMG